MPTLPILPASQSSRPTTLEAHDRGFRRRITIAIVISLALNAVIFGYAGILGHHFLQSLVIMREKDSEVSIQRVVISPSQLKEMSRPRPPLPAASPSPSASPNNAN